MESVEPEIKIRPPVPVHITVLKGSFLKGNKGDNPITYIHAEYNNLQLGDSGKVPMTLDTEVEYNFTTSFDCTFEGNAGLEDLVHKPVILTVIEILPKEKKKREEKTIVLGQAIVDLIPLLQGESTFRKTIQVHPVVGSPLDHIAPDAPKPILEVLVSVPEPLLTESQVKGSNLLRTTVESIYSVPEAWTTTGTHFSYFVILHVPAALEKEIRVVFSHGILKVPGEKESTPRLKKWPIINLSAAGAQYIPDSFIQPCPYENEDGELNQKQHWAFRTEAENEKKRVAWDLEKRCFMEQDALVRMQKQMAESRYWPVEIKRVPISTAAKGGAKSSKMDKAEDDGPISYHGVAYVNMAPLLYPGANRIRGAYPIVPFYEAEIFEKTKLRLNTVREPLAPVAKIAPVSHPPHTKGTPGKTKDEKGQKEKDLKKNSANVKVVTPILETVDVEPVPQNIEGEQYVEARSFIVLEFVLDKPLVQKRPPEEVSQRISEMIPPRAPFPRRTGGAEKAVEDYHSQILSVAGIIMNEYQDMFGSHKPEDKASFDGYDREEHKQKLMYELNASGKYFAFKEQIKHAVVKIVREKYLKTVAFEDREQLQSFLSELYVYLVDQMHCCLHKRLARDRNSPDHWFDYGVFYLVINENGKAEECFHQAVALNQQHLPSLILCGVISSMNQQYENAETFFQKATYADPKSVLAWTMQGLFYESQDNAILSEMAFFEAKKQHQAAQMLLRSLNATLDIKEPETSFGVDRPYDRASHDGSFPGSETGTRTSSIASSKPSGDGKIGKIGGSKSSKTGSGGKGRQNSVKSGSNSKLISDSKLNVGGSGSVTRMRAKSVSSSGGSKKKMSSIKEIPKILEEITTVGSTGSPGKPSEREPTPGPTTSIFLKTSEFLLNSNALEFVPRAMSHELLDADGGPSYQYNLLLAQFYVLRQEFEKAEHCLQEAARFNHQNPDIWALMGHVHYLSHNYTKAKEFYERTLSYAKDAIDMHTTCLRLGAIYLEENRTDSFKKAKSAYLLACKRTPSCLSWLGFGIASYRLSELRDAEDALAEANILCNSNSEVWGYLTLVCLKTGRKLEAEQSYKYAIKLNLQNQQLLDEIHHFQQMTGFGNPEF
ncbi:cilia- and flagella-associated protein 70 isoform X2 [Callorhinchus milii]|uniref:cilia- and flagella-associated protein 70 isoform X2 n=1 Tax=Callorhinchus milii TaxID=7868 RepID=UPI001C3F76E2|nr:cilia- and flagella-associated protein 70 isoform X2 [Callorhinchus milii]